MPTFTPPTLAEVSPIDPPHERHKNPLGNALFKYYPARERGATVFKYADGTYSINRNIELLNVPVFEPYPATLETSQNSNGGVVNDALAWSWYNSGTDQGTNAGYGGTKYPLPNPVTVIYYGGSSYTVTEAEANSLAAAGFEDYLT